MGRKPKPLKYTRRICIRATPALVDHLNRVCIAQNISQREFIEEAIESTFMEGLANWASTQIAVSDDQDYGQARAFRAEPKGGRDE